ncbi:MAG: hypothetical protein A2287_04680 [Candidatus Melainabacteria bacterium RIFOXYA12_FULL_32_12]|nr:MAG: hypothetical protein A2287_04680 [Candidatus Melainabacteria bacterium RIFOXYA12_FULL_32_12]
MIGNRLKQARETRGIKTIKELSQKSGVSEGTISKIENNLQDAKTETINLLNEILKANLNWLLNGEGPMLIEEQPECKQIPEAQKQVINNAIEYVELMEKVSEGDIEAADQAKETFRKLKEALKNPEVIKQQPLEDELYKKFKEFMKREGL